MQHLAEEVERAALEDLHAAAGPELRAGLGLAGRAMEETFVSIASALPASAIVINRAIGTGLTAPATPESLRDIVAAYRSAGVARYFVHVHPDARPAQIGEWLFALGLEQARGWQKFTRGRETVPSSRTDLSLREIGQESASDWAVIVSDAFDLGEQARPWLAQLPGRNRWSVFMSFDDGVPVGTGALFIDGDVAWADFGATAPQFRRRGSQTALLCHRLEFALDHGCRQVFTCTGEAVPGDPQHSYSNILKAGFRESYVRPNFAPRKHS